jgi:hypothetical protein
MCLCGNNRWDGGTVVTVRRPDSDLATTLWASTLYTQLSCHHFISTSDMADQSENSESARFRSLFESALQAYDKKVGVTLAQHPLAAQLNNCHSIESITTVLQAQVQAFSEFQGSETIIKSINNTVSILTRLSATASLGDPISLVRQKALTYSIALTIFTAIPTH